MWVVVKDVLELLDIGVNAVFVQRVSLACSDTR